MGDMDNLDPESLAIYLECGQRNIMLAVDDDGEHLRYRAPRGVMNQDTLQRLLDNKTNLVKFLKSWHNINPNMGERVH